MMESPLHTVRRPPAIGASVGGIRQPVALVACLCWISAHAALAAESHVDRANAAFRTALREDYAAERALDVAAIQAGWDDYRGSRPEAFVPEALARLYPQFDEALDAYDRQASDDAARILEPLLTHDDPFLSANATYLYARALVDQALFEEAAAVLNEALAAPDGIEPYTPYAPHLWFLLAASEARCLDEERVARALDQLERRFSAAAEPVAIGSRQLRLELERRERGTLGEVARVMDYVADRLHATDVDVPVRERQEEVLTLLDKLIEEHEQQEQQQGGASGGGGQQAQPGQGGAPSGGRPTSPAEESRAPEGSGRIGELHEAPQANPGEMWGQLPPAERQRILQSIQERFPSRYRQLVEQYYRALAEGDS